MRLYLVQHGSAKTKEEDPDRHLSEEGVNGVEKTAAFLAPLGLSVGAVWHSGKARAARTAEMLASSLQVARGVVERDGLASKDAVGPVAKALARAEEDLMIVGHLPFLAKLTSALAAGRKSADVIDFQNAGVVCLERAEDGAWRVRWMVTPDLLP